MDVWWNNHFLSKGLESSNWNNHFKVDVSGTRHTTLVLTKSYQSQKVDPLSHRSLISFSTGSTAGVSPKTWKVILQEEKAKNTAMANVFIFLGCLDGVYTLLKKKYKFGRWLSYWKGWFFRFHVSFRGSSGFLHLRVFSRSWGCNIVFFGHDLSRKKSHTGATPLSTGKCQVLGVDV